MTATALPMPIVGERVCLRPFRRSDLPHVIAWRNDPEVRAGALWDDGVFGTAEAERWLRAVSGDSHRVTLAIDLRSDGRLVGLTNLSKIDPPAGTAYFGVVIGDRTLWGRGLARETLGLMVTRAAALGLHTVFLEVAQDNPRALRLYRRFGFETKRMVSRPRQGTTIDVSIMSLRLPQ